MGERPGLHGCIPRLRDVQEVHGLGDMLGWSKALTGSAANPVKRVLVGGQELWLDTVCAYP